jgi:DNA-binding MarR family transcriptional regulator
VDEIPGTHACLSFLVRHAWLSMRTVVAGALAEHELSVAQYGTLILVAEQPGITVAEVARKVGSARQSANEMLAGLERAGLVERRAHPKDRRAQQVFLTTAGRERMDAATPSVRAVEEQLELDFSASDRKAVRAWLTRMADSAAPSPEEISTQ